MGRRRGSDRPVETAAKRALDVAVSGGAIIALSPVFAGITALELWFHGWPPIFAQRRPGRFGEIFTVYKFRTMTEARDENGELLPDAARLTRFGRFLRASSLDELPELWNVLRGEMSLVGPRPLLVEYLDRYTPEQSRRHDVFPGLTGWAQVHGRNALSWERKFELDVWYVDHWSFWLDLKILLQTALIVLRREGISAEGEATMPNFMGSPPQMNGGAPGGNPSSRSTSGERPAGLAPQAALGGADPA